MAGLDRFLGNFDCISAFNSFQNQHLAHTNSIFCSRCARLHWLEKGDRNNSYFHRVAKICHHKKKINALRDNAGNIFTSQDDIENCFLNFYKDLWSSSSSFNLAQTFQALLDDFPILSPEDKIALTKPVSKGEVFRTFRSMPRGKSPGSDWLNVEFYVY